MANLGRSNRKIEKPGFVGCSGIFLLLVANFQFVATSVKWTAPPPVWTQTDPKDIKTANMSITKGRTEVPLSWSYTLLSGSLILTTFSLRLKDGSFDDIGTTAGGVFNKEDYQTRFGISGSEVATLIIKNVTEREAKVYQCKLLTDLNTWSYRIEVTVRVESSITSDSGNQTENEGSNITVFCNASGNPTPNITWTRVWENGTDGDVVFFGNPWVIVNISRTATGTYRCTADNRIGSPVNRLLYVNVTYPAKIVKLVSEHNVTSQQSVSLVCQAKGNPQPTYSWTPCDSKQNLCHKSVLSFKASNESVYRFTCKVENSLGSDTGNTILFIASDVINVTLVITGEECTDGENNQLWEKLRKMIEDIFADKPHYESVQLKRIRCGSVNVDLALKFNATVRESDVLSILKDAVKNGEFGGFSVTAITGTRDTGITPTMATTPNSSSNNTTWIIVGVVVGVVVVLAVAGGVAWYVYKKRKCKKRDSKVHNNGSQGEAGGNVQEEGYVQVNKGYEERANRRSGGGNTSSAPPVLYDTAQTGNRGAVKGPPLPEYAVVDKSKKKPKKPKPGELQYAELAEFSTGQGGQRSSLSPTNRLTETQYADVNAM